MTSIALAGKFIAHNDWSSPEHFRFEERSMAYFGHTKMCSTCSVVLPSPYLEGKAWGKEIDQASCVVRFNNHEAKAAPVKDWGKREDIKLVNHNFDTLQTIFKDSCFKQMHNTCRRVVVINGEWDESHPQYGFYQVFMEHHQGIEVISKKLWTDVVDVFNKLPKNVTSDTKLEPSSGFFAVHWLRDAAVCGKVTLYGMPSESEEARNVANGTQYRDIDTNQVMYDCHDMKAEHDFIRRKVSTGEWTNLRIKS